MISILPSRFVRHPLSAGVLALMSLALGSTGASAQDTKPVTPEPTQSLDLVQVTGTRASLERALTLKRNAAGVQDSISATELGRFPDDNVADSLSHITGVSITRTAGGEGRSVSVRGLGPQYTLTTFNGRILGTDGAGRDFAFDVLPSDIINGADVIKSAQASVTEGGIGGVINLRSASPFDQRGQHGLLRVEGDHNLMSGKNGGKISGTYSNTFGDKVGVLVGLVYADRKVRTDTAGNDGGWSRNAAPSDPSWLWGNTWGGAIDPNNNGKLDANEEGLIGPGQFRIGSILEQKKRLALSGKVEWRPSNDIKVVLDGIKTRLDSPQVGYQQSFYTVYSPGAWSNVKTANGIVTEFTTQSLNPELLNKTEHRVVDTALYGLNGEWKATQDLTLTGDVYRSTSSRHSGGLDTYAVLRMNQPNTSLIRLTGSGIPDVITTFNDGRDLSKGLAAGQFTAKDFNTHYLGLQGDNVDDRITGASAGGVLTIDKYNVDALRFGFSNTDRRKSRDMINNAINGGDGYYSGNNAINVATLGGSVLSQSFTLPGFMEKVGGNFPRSFLGFDVPSYLAQLQAYNGKARPGGGTYDYSKAGPEWNPLESYRVTEKSSAAFVQADLSGTQWNADVGVRFVKSSTTSQAWDAKITSIIKNGDFNYTAVYAKPSIVQQQVDANYVLPSGNFVWHFTDALQLRVAAAKTMARPAVDKLAPTSTTGSVSWGEFTQLYGGNAALKPYSAVQGDLSLEWYYAKSSAFNVAIYQKNIKNQLTTSWEPQVDIGVPGHLFNIIRPINGDTAKVRGIEFGLQHLWDNGFGVRGQFSRNIARSWVGGEVRPLEGIAPSTMSLGGLYEKGPWSLSVTADHTKGFVTAVNVIGAGFNEQIEPVTWLTAQASYEVNKNLRLSIEGRNLLDAEEKYSLSGNPLLSTGYNRYGRAFTVSANLKF